MTNSVSVRDAHVSDIPAIAAVIHGIGLFTPEEAEGFASTIPDHFAQPSEGHVWLVAGDGQGAGYLAPKAAGPGV